MTRALPRPLCAALVLLAAGAAHAADPDNCEGLRAQIEAKVVAAGVTRFAVRVADIDAPLPGRVVGSCALGRKKIVYQQDEAPAPSGAPQTEPPMLTECRDGSVRLGGSCGS